MIITRLGKYKDYETYLKSYEWRMISREAKLRASRRCQLCNSENDLQVHHRSYENLGRELETNFRDLIILCERCHTHFHSITRGKHESAEKYTNI